MSLQPSCTCKVGVTTNDTFYIKDRTGCVHHSDEAIAELAAAREAAKHRACTDQDCVHIDGRCHHGLAH